MRFGLVVRGDMFDDRGPYAVYAAYAEDAEMPDRDLLGDALCGDSGYPWAARLGEPKCVGSRPGEALRVPAPMEALDWDEMSDETTAAEEGREPPNRTPEGLGTV